MRVALLALGIVGCAHQSTVLPQPFRFEARTTHGVVRVMPVLALHTEQDLDLQSYVGPRVPWRQEWLRGRRVSEMDLIPGLLGRALPGEVNGELGQAWDGTFLNGSLGPVERASLRSALRGRGDLDATLSAVGRGVDGSASLFVWVDELEGRPLTSRGFAGEIVHTDCGPVVLDLLEEPYLVEASVGMALVASDGEVVLRMREHLSTVLSSRRDADAAARDLARALAGEVTKVWATDPRLDDGPSYGALPPLARL